MKNNLNIIGLLILQVFLFSLQSGSAQTDTLPNLNSPYHTIYTHLHFLQEEFFDPEKAGAVIHPDFRDGKAGQKAVKLKRIMDGRGLYVLLSDLPANSNYRDTTTHRNVYTLFPVRLPDIYLEKIDGQWYYSEETMKDLQSLYKSTFPYGVDRLLDMVPANDSKKYLGLSKWQYIALGSLFLLAFLIYWVARIVYVPIVRLIRRLLTNKFHLTRDEMRHLVHLLGLISALYSFQVLLPALQLPVELNKFLLITFKIGQMIFVIWLAFEILSDIKHHLKEIVGETETKVDDQLLPILFKTAHVIIILAALVYILRLFQVNVAAIIAGLSLGGLAIALAAQDTVKNFIGSLMIIMDRPFQVGDYVSTNGLEGTVVEVGFRTSRIQMIDTSIISIPNGQLADSSITNLGVRPKRIINIKLGVMYDTQPDRMEAFIQGLKQIILDHPGLSDEPMYVHLNDFGASSIDILFRCYIEVLTYPEELAIREEVMFKILNLASDIGVSFAFPSTSVYFENSIPQES